MTTCEPNDLCRQIHCIAQDLFNSAEKTLKPYDLTPEQLHPLKSMSANEGLTQRELGDLAGKTPANMTRLLDRLEAKELVERRNSTEDRRISLVFLTPKGLALVDEVKEIFDGYLETLYRGISAKEREAARKTLEKIQANIDDIHPQQKAEVKHESS